MNAFGLTFTEPLWLLLLPALIVGFLVRQQPSHFIRKSTYERGERQTNGYAHCALSRFFLGCALVALVVALADPLRGFTSLIEEVPRNRIIVAVDNSSSMYNFEDRGPLYCTDPVLKQRYPRIYIGCRTLVRLIDGVEEFARTHTKRAPDLIGILRFALYSKVQSYPTTDYARLRKQVLEMNWVLSGHLGVNTEIHLALWDMFLMALQRNMTRDTGLTFLTGENMRKLAASLAPGPGAGSFSPPAALVEKSGTLKEELRDTVFIMVTDAYPGQLESRLHKAPVSFKKLSELATLLELPIYILSTDEPNTIYQRLVRETGFGPPGGPHRGNFFSLKAGRGDNIDAVETLIQSILAARFQKTVRIVVERRTSYATEAAVLALTFVVCGVLSRETLDRSLTDT